MKKAVLFFCVFMVAAGTSFALDLTSGPETVQPGNILLSGGFAMGNGSGAYDGGWLSGSGSAGLYGFSLVADYALPFFGLTLGVETGYYGGSVYYVDVGALPIMGRLGYHPDFGNANLDIYALVKTGFAMAFVGSGDYSTSSGLLGFGFGLGGRYFFSDAFAAFIELGIDSYSFDIADTKGTARKLVTIGATYKLAGTGGAFSGGSASSGGGRISTGSAVSSASGGLVIAPESDFGVALGADNKTAVITKYNGRGGRIIIPDTIQGMPVVQIAEGAFSDNIRVIEVVVPEGVTEIGANAFNGCTRLTRVTLPSTIRSIDKGAFNSCGELLEVSIPDGVRITWNGDAFAGSSKIMLATQARLRALGYSGSF